jgi:hypothetical protein
VKKVIPQIPIEKDGLTEEDNRNFTEALNIAKRGNVIPQRLIHKLEQSKEA